MKLLIATPYFYPKIGGMEKYAYTIARGLSEKYGWDIIVVTSNHETRKFREEFIDGIRIYRLPIYFKLSNTPINPFWVFSIIRILNNEKPDIINVHTPVPYMADIFAAIHKTRPLVVTYHTGSMIKGHSFFDIIIKTYEKHILPILFNNAEKIICVSTYVQSFISPKYYKKTNVISPGVDLNLFKYKKLKKNKTFTILHIGGLKKAEGLKRFIDLLYAVKKLKDKGIDVQLVAIGNGDNINNFKVLANKLGISKKVLFPGQLVGEYLVKEYQKSDLLVMPSLKEGFGMAVIEAMACKIPVAGADDGGIKEIIKDRETGFLFKPENVDSLASTLEFIIDNPNIVNKVANNGYKHVMKEYSWEKKIRDTNKLYRNIL